MNTRRAFIKSAATTAGVLMSGLPKGWVGGVYADDGPETKTIRFGIIALTDCAPIVMAHELGYFKKFGIESVISKEASWAVIRDKLSLGENQATHMLIGMPLASTMGLAGSPVKPMVIPWLLNRNGQAITLNNKLKQAGVRKPADVKPLAEKAKAAGEPLAFAMTFPPGTHAMWMRYWLAAGGVHPDKDVSLITIPPPPPAGPDPGLLDLWDQGLWDTAIWDAGNPPAPVVRDTGWVSVGLTGYSHAPIVQVTVAQQAKPEVDLISVAATYERAGINV